MKFSTRVQFVLLVGLIILNLIFRIPTAPHEIGVDSFDIHVLANSISEFGEAKWWTNSLSIGGFYPLSYASAVPFILSGISQCTSVDMELIILLYSLVIGVFSIFTAYTLAGVIWNNDLFKFLCAFTFSTSQGVLTFSTWTATTRGVFIVLLPLFIYLLLKNRSSMYKYSVLTIILLILLSVIHNMVYFILPVIISYFAMLLFYRWKKYLNLIKIPDNVVNIGLFALLFGMFLTPFFTREFGGIDPEFGGIGSRYVLIVSMITTYVRYIGVLFVFIFGGLTFLLLKSNKQFEEWFILLVLIFLTPFLYMATYMKFFILIFAFLLICIGLTNVVIILVRMETFMRKRKSMKKYSSFLIIGILLFSISFSGYYQNIHFLKNPTSYSRYMQDSTYAGGLWIGDNINKNIFYVYESWLVALKTFAISEVPTVFGDAIGQSYGFENIDELNLTHNSPLSTSYYIYGPYIKTWGITDVRGYCEIFMSNKINSPYGKNMIRRFNISYIIEDEKRFSNNIFIRSIRENVDAISVYSNGKIRIWYLL